MNKTQSDVVKTERTAVKCMKCGSSRPINELVKEEVLPYPHNNVVEGYLLCPDCGLRTHSYYLPEPLRHEQDRLRTALELYQKDKSPKAWRMFSQLQKNYQNNFTTAQEKYTKVMETATSG